MAPTSRARLLARALREAGVDVRVLVLQADERPPHVENTEVRGVYRGVPFEYAAGRTVLHGSFVVRRLVELRGWGTGALRLVQARRKGELDVVYLWVTSQWLQARRLGFLTLLRALGVPVMLELSERPWALREDAGPLERRLSPLAGVAGVVAISDVLTGWVRAEARRLGRDVRLVEVPIVADLDERAPEPYPSGEPPVVVFAGSPEYEQAIRFILEAMRTVWERVPGCELVVTGTNPSDPAARWLLEEAAGAGPDARVRFAGYLSRQDLLALYGRARALLVPLFEDVRSHARFPTKIGEYLAAARPVVTSAVGEIPRFFSDGVDGVVTPAGDAREFGARLADLLERPEAAAGIGLAGRALAERTFSYDLYGPRLASALAAVAARPGRRT
jgi:glycosyltransferase involved in cell wall biosynthesis